jgi:hypothetical protein
VIAEPVVRASNLPEWPIPIKRKKPARLTAAVNGRTSPVVRPRTGARLGTASTTPHRLSVAHP